MPRVDASKTVWTEATPRSDLDISFRRKEGSRARATFHATLPRQHAGISSINHAGMLFELATVAPHAQL
eukprot:1194410-Rhodomonas_salina.1